MTEQGLTTAVWWPGEIMQVKVPLPFSLKWVNSYLVKDEKGYTLIDPGLHTSEALDTWTAVLTNHHIEVDRIHTILLTHQHPDHYGLAGWFQERTGALVLLSRQSYAYAQRLWGENRSFGSDLTSLYAQHDTPKSVLDQIDPHLESFVEKVSPQPTVTFIEAGQTLMIGGYGYQSIAAPGHARGQLCFYSPERRWMFCGDQVLPNITPNISVVPGEEEDPLQQFLDSLRQLRLYNVELAFPGHRDPFSNFETRINEIIEHHDRRLDAMQKLLEEKAYTGFEMCEKLFGARIAGNIHQFRFAMSETLAHLFHLERLDRITAEKQAGIMTYRT
ncbi:MBL fold metallo-hydrolase [Paenibacillus baekrokdamisoli]|uniref:MBL fold metallo-hydrolase n=1 Tax=Paenibacillus baekrokdamisoli TaxID=1712516 RepID=A0A3G9J6S0_9BACL|nr:MBL fold metallo-hydrolase [Paenibacillus baekrokdamisoli]MBB3071044.1 glyoxylase-like metal-dependent hydrolase (beta-lactamase superfamily II) [Paenibacillus baekrokdamisoli]BBH21461.1 MBL fold metallo-hydrolase [Paenibacillus baekrokdamisoli]